MRAPAIFCPECQCRLILHESMHGAVITIKHPRPGSPVVARIPGLGGGIAGAPLTIREVARSFHDPFGP